jgi:hypothetical protein
VSDLDSEDLVAEVIELRPFAVQLSFFRGSSLDPEPPKAGKHPEVRYLDIHEDDPVDEAQLTSWITQASRLPGEHI